MKKISAVLVIIIFLTLIKLQVFAQISLSTENISVIKTYHLAVTYNKTTNLVFPYAIKSVDRGSKDILVQKAKDVENILQQRITLVAEIEKYSADMNEMFFVVNSNLSKLADMLFVYESCNTLRKQELLRKVFDNKLYYHSGVCRTRYLMNIF